MRAFIIGLLCLFLWTSVARYIYVCKIKNQCHSEVAATPASNRLMNLNLMDGNTIILENYEQFSFAKNEISPTLSADNNRFLDGLAAFLKNNPDKNLEITGHFRPTEASISNGIYENLGLARANVIKDLLMQRGITKERLFLNYNSGTEALSMPLTFKVLPSTPDESDDTDERIITSQYSFENMVFSDANFESSSAVFQPGTAFLNWADSVQIYLQLNTEKKLNIIGHTDKTGSVPYNKNLGLDRAKAARDYFINKGVVAPIRVSTMGEKQPIATNRTKEGRQRNRRVNFVIE